MKLPFKKKRLIPILLFAASVACAARILYLNAQWPAAEVITVSRGEVWDNDGVQVEIIDSVLGSAQETLSYYGRPCDTIAEEDVLSMMDEGWHGYVMAVKVRVTNTTEQDIIVGQYSCSYAESVPWYNGYDVLQYPLFNEILDNVVLSGSSLNIVMPYAVYQEKFSASEWSNLKDRPFYLVSQSVYPRKVQLECTPILLESAQKEFNV